LNEESYIIIDALDECDDREAIFELLNGMLDSKSAVKAFVSFRPKRETVESTEG
jgi:hypothetical protein